MIRGAFEYQGQKCSAMSRAYIPKNIWAKLKLKYLTELKTIKVGPPDDFSNFINAVIDKKAFDSITSYISYASKKKDAEIISGENTMIIGLLYFTNYDCYNKSQIQNFRGRNFRTSFNYISLRSI